MGRSPQPARPDWRAPALLVLAYVLVVSTCMFRHELWLDEANPWVIARDAHSLGELKFNMRFEPHPGLWYLLLYIVTRFTSRPAAMQALHVMIATASVTILAFRAPFRLRDKWLLVFGYYLVFEYAVISRGYSLGILLAFILATTLQSPRARPIWTAILLALLANTSAFGLLLSVAIVAGLLADGRLRPAFGVRTTLAAIVVCAGAALSVLTMRPIPESIYGRNMHTYVSGGRVEGVLDLFWTAFLPLPDWRSAGPWNTYLVLRQPAWLARDIRSLSAIAAVALALALLWSFRRRRAAAVIFLVGSLGVAALIYLEYSAGYRHHGHFFVLWVLASWLATRPPSRDARAPSRPQTSMGFLAAASVVAGAFFVVADVARPFSYSKDLAAYVKTLPHGVPVVVVQKELLSYVGPPLSAYLRRPVFYALSGGIVKGSYLLYDRAHRGATDEQILGDLNEFAARYGTDVYVVTNHWDAAVLGPPLVTFSDHLVHDEWSCSVYLLKRRSPFAPTARVSVPPSPLLDRVSTVAPCRRTPARQTHARVPLLTPSPHRRNLA